MIKNYASAFFVGTVAGVMSTIIGITLSIIFVEASIDEQRRAAWDEAHWRGNGEGYAS